MPEREEELFLQYVSFILSKRRPLVVATLLVYNKHLRSLAAESYLGESYALDASGLPGWPPPP